jgi:uncharacterized protein (UPF0303 family)
MTITTMKNHTTFAIGERVRHANKDTVPKFTGTVIRIDLTETKHPVFMIKWDHDVLPGFHNGFELIQIGG